MYHLSADHQENSELLKYCVQWEGQKPHNHVYCHIMFMRVILIKIHPYRVSIRLITCTSPLTAITLCQVSLNSLAVQKPILRSSVCAILFKLTYSDTAHKSTSVLYGKKHVISRELLNAQTQDKYQHVAKSLYQIVETSTCLKTTQQETTNFTVRLLMESDWLVFSCAPECSK